MDDRRDYLDGWRGLAILFVLVAHFAPIPSIDSGRLGVDIFFVLSGLLMSELLFVKRTPLGLFYRRRISRILPAFVVFVCVVYGVGYLAGHRYPWTDFASTLTFLRSYVPVSPGIWEIDLPTHHLWSLNVEEHCYLLMSLMVLIVRKHAAVALIGFGLAAIAIHVAYIRVPDIAPVHYELHTEVVASTLLLSAGYRLIRGKVWSWLPVAAFVVALVAYFDLAPWWSVMLLAPFLLGFTVNHLGDAPAVVLRALSWPPLRYMGLWSYSIYLWQQPFYMYDHLGIWSLPCAMGLALLSYYGLEKPVRGWLNTHWSVRATSTLAHPRSARSSVATAAAPHPR